MAMVPRNRYRSLSFITRNKYRKIILLTCLTIYIGFVYHSTFGDGDIVSSSNSIPHNGTSHITRSKRRNESKVIMFYTDYFEEMEWTFLDNGNTLYEGDDFKERCSCDAKPCEFTYNLSRYTETSAVIFHGVDLPAVDKYLKVLDDSRPKGQLWMYVIVEAGMVNKLYDPYAHYFDVTATYQFDSDIRVPYHLYRRKEENESKINNSFIDYYSLSYTYQIGWLVDVGDRPRGRLATKLIELGLEVWVMGDYGKKFMRGSRNFICSGKCVDELKQFRFYLAAEDNFCKDFVSERYWKFSINAHAIPIVLGGANYSDPRVAIPGSYINALDFPNVTALADYIKKVDGNKTLYNEYFKWRSKYTVYAEKPGCPEFLCTICKRVHSPVTNIPRMLTDGECDGNLRRYEKWINQ